MNRRQQQRILNKELDEILTSMLPTTIPTKYVESVEVIDRNGDKAYYYGEEAIDIVEDYDFHIKNKTFYEMIVMLDIQRIKDSINKSMSMIFDE